MKQVLSSFILSPHTLLLLSKLFNQEFNTQAIWSSFTPLYSPVSLKMIYSRGWYAGLNFGTFQICSQSFAFVWVFLFHLFFCGGWGVGLGKKDVALFQFFYIRWYIPICCQIFYFCKSVSSKCGLISILLSTVIQLWSGHKLA